MPTPVLPDKAQARLPDSDVPHECVCGDGLVATRMSETMVAWRCPGCKRRGTITRGSGRTA